MKKFFSSEGFYMESGGEKKRGREDADGGVGPNIKRDGEDGLLFLVFCRFFCLTFIGRSLYRN